jgi:hypothetical protein
MQVGFPDRNLMRRAGNTQGQWDVQTNAEIVGRWELELEFFAHAILFNSVKGKVPSNKLPNPDLCTNNIWYLPVQLSCQTRASKVFVFSGMCFRYPRDYPHRPRLHPACSPLECGHLSLLVVIPLPWIFRLWFKLSLGR